MSFDCAHTHIRWGIIHGGGGGGLPFACPPCVVVGALCVPCAEVLLLEASGGLVEALQFSCNFPAISRKSPQYFAIGFDAS